MSRGRQSISSFLHTEIKIVYHFQLASLIVYPEIQEGNAGNARCTNCCINSSDCPRFQWSLAQCCEVCTHLTINAYFWSLERELVCPIGFVKVAIKVWTFQLEIFKASLMNFVLLGSWVHCRLFLWWLLLGLDCMNLVSLGYVQIWLILCCGYFTYHGLSLILAFIV